MASENTKVANQAASNEVAANAVSEAVAELTDIMSYDEARYLGVGKLESTQIELMNIGITKLDESTNPAEKSVQYIGQKSKSNKVTGYDNQFSIESDLIKNEKVVEDIYDVLYYRKTGVEAQRYLYLVDLWKPVEEKTGVYKARKLKVSIVLSSKASTPGETITFSGDLKGIGDFEYGTFDISTKTFTASANN